MKAPSWLIKESLREDLGKNGDLTTRFFVPSNAKISASIVLKADGVICGTEIARQIFQKLDPSARFKIIVQDGRYAKSGQKIAQIQ